MYTIIEVKDPRFVRPAPIAEVATLEEAQAFLDGQPGIVVCFERDADHDAADALVARSPLDLVQYSIERK